MNKILNHTGLFLVCILLSGTILAQNPPPPPGEKQFVITVFLEGLYDVPNLEMRKAMDHDGNSPYPRYQGQIADVIILELHDQNNYGTPVWAPITINLNQNGMAVAYLPASGVYYLTIKNRNHIETVSATTINLATDNSYNFSNAANKAYGSNQKLLATGVYGIYAGDVNQDGVVNISDRNIINDAYQTTSIGYLTSDVNGDGTVNISDRNIANDAYQSTISKKIPN